MTNISTTAAAARESARTPDGQFGEQERTSAEVSLAPTVLTVADAQAARDAAEAAAEQAAYAWIRHRAHDAQMKNTLLLPGEEQSGYELAEYTVAVKSTATIDAASDVNEAASYLNDPSALGMQKHGERGYLLTAAETTDVPGAHDAYEAAIDEYHRANKAAAIAAGAQLRAHIPDDVEIELVSDDGDYGDLRTEGIWLLDISDRNPAAADGISDAVGLLNEANARDAGLRWDRHEQYWTLA